MQTFQHEPMPSSLFAQTDQTYLHFSAHPVLRSGEIHQQRYYNLSGKPQLLNLTNVSKTFTNLISYKCKRHIYIINMYNNCNCLEQGKR